MARKKKGKAKAKKTKKKVKKATSARKKVARPAARKKKSGAKKPAKAKAKGARMAPAAAKPAAASAPPAGMRVGTVTHYFTHLSVAIVQLETASLREGDTVHVKGHTSDFKQRIESMELDHVRVSEAHPGQSVGLRVREHARENDVLYKVA